MDIPGEIRLARNKDMGDKVGVTSVQEKMREMRLSDSDM